MPLKKEIKEAYCNKHLKFGPKRNFKVIAIEPFYDLAKIPGPVDHIFHYSKNK